MASVDFLVKLRDAAVMISDACEEYLEKLAPKEEKKDAHKYDSLFWETKQGNKGEYEQTSEKANGNSELWQDLKSWLEKNQGKARLGEFFFWQFSNEPTTVGRKKTKK